MASDNQIIFSIIIPAKDEEKFIIHCLQAMRYLDFNPDEMETIVVDNGSTDRTVALAKEYGAKVIVINSGTIGKLRNEGAKIASGKILAFIDADCVPGRHWLKNALPHFENPQIAAVGSKPSLPEHGTTWVENTWLIMKQIPKYGETKWLSSSNFIVRKSVFDQVNGFDKSLVTCEDADIGYKISQRWKMLNDPSVKIIHLREPKTISQFFKKELWHGAANYQGIMKHGFLLHELPSLILPLITLGCVIGMGLGLLLSSGKLMTMSMIFLFFPPVLLTIKVITRTGNLSRLILILYLSFVYSLARSAAIFKWK